MNKKTRNIISISIAILPINLIMIWYRLTQTESFTTSDMIIYPMIFGGVTIILILLLNKYVVLDTFRSTFNKGNGTWYWDILSGLILTAISFILFFIEKQTLMMWLPNNNPASKEVVNVLIDIANKPILLIIWFIPVLWIGIALFEELSRIFLLKCLWNISENKKWIIVAILLTSILIGTVHLYQGIAGVISILVKSIVFCLFYYKYRRLLPLIIAHALYDGLQFAYLIVQLRQLY